MVYESPAAGRAVVCRKHSPWTMERDRKKSKAHLGSPEPLSEEVEEEQEEEEQPDDDHEMTEQEAHVLACLGQLNVKSLLANRGDSDSSGLSRAGSMIEGQRRKLRGSRALSASYHNRLRSCMLHEKGSPLSHSTRSFTTGTGGGQENTAPLLFAPVMFGEHSKCWLGRRPSPRTKDTSGPTQPHHGATGLTHPSNFPSHGPVQSADQSLLVAAAAVNSSRLDKHPPCDSPAPRGRSHRRSHSGASVGAVCGLNDSAEALHGPSEGCTGSQGQPPQSGVWPHGRGVSEGSGQRRGAVPSKTAGLASGDPVGVSVSGVPVNARPCGNDLRNPGDPADRSRPASSPLASALPSGLPTATLSLAKYGIAAFGVPASVQSCFADPVAVQRPTGGVGPVVASCMIAAHQRDPARCTMSCPVDMSNAAPAAGALGWHCGAGSCTSGSSGAATAGTSSLASGILLELCTEPLVDASSEPELALHVRHGPPLSAGGTGADKALADSAEEMELRRMTHQPHPAPLVSHGSFRGQQKAAEPLRPGAPHSRPSSTGSAAATCADTFGAAVSEPLPGAGPAPLFVPLDLVSLARTAGAAFGATDFTSFSTSGHFSVESVQGAASSTALPLSLSLWPGSRSGSQGGSTINLSSALAANDISVNPLGVQSVAGDGRSTPQRRPGDAAAASAITSDVGHEAAQRTGTRALELKSPAGDAGNVLGGDDRCDQDLGGADGDDGESWLRTSQQAPDPDDPSSAGKYSAVLLRRLQAAAEHEELYGVAASGGHSGAYGFYPLQVQVSYGSELRRSSGGGGLHLGSHGSSSMEPSPLPRMSSRLRRLRVSPCLGGSGGGSGGPLTAPAPSHLLGTRSRSAGVTPGGVTCRRLRRRSDLLMQDQLGQGSVSARGHADVDELEDSDSAAGADEHMQDAAHQLFAAGGSGGRLRLVAERIGADPAACTHQHRGGVLTLHARCISMSVSGLQAARSPELRSEPKQRISSQGPEAVAARAHSAADQLLFLPKHRLQPHMGEDYLSGLMDYNDDDAEYATPPHTPLRGVGGAQDHDPSTTARAVLASLAGSGVAPKPRGACAGDEDFFAAVPVLGRAGLGRGLLQQRVTFAADRLGGGADTHVAAYCGHDGDGASCAQLLMLQSLESTQEFNRCLALAATSNDRGSADRLWQEMCSRGVTPDADTLNLLLRCLSRSAADPDEAQLLVRDVCRRGGLPMNATAQRLLEEICFRFELMNGSTLGA